MNPFRKSKRSVYHDPGSATVNETIIIASKTVSTKDCPEPTTMIEVKRGNVSDVAKAARLPKDEEYLLRDMLAAGQVPQEVPVHGMLDSQDPLDLSNAGVADALFDKVSSEVKSPEPAPASAEPAPSNEPSNAQ